MLCLGLGSGLPSCLLAQLSRQQTPTQSFRRAGVLPVLLVIAIKPGLNVHEYTGVKLIDAAVLASASRCCLLMHAIPRRQTKAGPVAYWCPGIQSHSLVVLRPTCQSCLDGIVPPVVPSLVHHVHVTKALRDQGRRSFWHQSFRPSPHVPIMSGRDCSPGRAEPFTSRTRHEGPA
jgi:hypothetical protein